MIGRKSTSRARVMAARGKASMNARGTSTSPPPGVSRGSPQSSVKKGMPGKPSASEMQQMETIKSITSKGSPSASQKAAMDAMAARQKVSYQAPSGATRPTGPRRSINDIPEGISYVPEIPRSAPRASDSDLRSMPGSPYAPTSPIQSSAQPTGGAKQPMLSQQQQHAMLRPSAGQQGMKKGGMVKSKGIDGCATKSKTKGRYI